MSLSRKKKWIVMTSYFWLFFMDTASCEMIQNKQLYQNSDIQRSAIRDLTITGRASENPNIRPLKCSCPPYQNTSIEFQKFKRDADPNDKSLYLKHTTIVSHLVNGIYLQSGLMDGKIPVNDLVGELLNFGSVKVSDVVNFTPDKITALTNKLKEVGNTLTQGDGASKETLALELEAIRWNQIRIDSESVGDVLKVANKAEFEKDLKELPNLLADLTIMQTTFASYIQEIEEVAEAAQKTDDSVQQIKLKGGLDVIGALRKEQDKSYGKFEKAVQELNKLKYLKNASNMYKPLKTMLRLMTERGNRPDSNQEPVKVNIKKVLESSSLFESANKDCTDLNELVESQIRPTASTKKHTVGSLSDLKTLSKDVKDSWIESVMHASDAQLNRMLKGFQPLLKLNEILNGTDSKLKLISSSEISSSIFEIQKLRSLVSTIPSESAGSVDVLNGYIECYKLSGTIDPSDRKKSDEFVEIIDKLVKFTTEVNTFHSKFNAAKFKEEIDTFLQSLPTDSPKSLSTDLKDSQKLANLKNRLQETKKPFDGFKSDEINIEISKALQGDGTASFKIGIEREKEMYDCLKKHASKGEQLSQVVKIIQKVRTFDFKQTENLDIAASTVSQISKDLSNIKSIPETMKKGVKEATTEINKLPEPAKTTQAIGRSVKSLQSGFELKSLESSIAILKNVGNIVDAEIQKIQSPQERTSVGKLWGDHSKDMTALEASLASFKSFEAKIDVSKAKTMGDYGTPLKDLGSVSDPKINAKDKLKALDTLISSAQDPKIRSDLEEAKKTLETISTLDLKFSSHKSQFQTAPEAFKTFEKFLADFFASDVSEEKKAAESASKLAMILGITLGSVLLALIIGGVFAFLRHRKKEKQKLKERLDEERKREAEEALKERQKDQAELDAKGQKMMTIIKWCSDQSFADERQAVQLTKALMYQVFLADPISYTESISFLGWDKHRYPKTVPCKRASSVTLKDNQSFVIHANFITMLDKAFIAAQGPMKNTMADFWLMIWEHKCVSIVMLCQFVEENVEKCGEYFNVRVEGAVTFGQFTIKTVSSTPILDGKGVERTLEVTRNGDATKQTIHHFQYLQWPENGIPAGHKNMYNLMKMAKENNSEAPLLVHCSSGVGRTVAFIGMEYVTREVERNPEFSFSQAVQNLCACRSLGIQTLEQLAWLRVAAVYSLIMNNHLPTDYYTEQRIALDGCLERLRGAQIELNAMTKEERKAREREQREIDREQSRAGAGGEGAPFETISHGWGFVSVDWREDEECLKAVMLFEFIDQFDPSIFDDVEDQRPDHVVIEIGDF